MFSDPGVLCQPTNQTTRTDITEKLENNDETSAEDKPLCRILNPLGIEAAVELLPDGVTIGVKIRNTCYFCWSRTLAEPPLAAYSKFVTAGE